MIESILVENVLVIEYKAGLNKEGKDIFKKTQINVNNTDITDEELFELGHAIGELLYTPIYNISKGVKYSLIDL